MKRMIIVGLMLAGAAFAGYVAYGFGKSLVGTTTPTVLNVGPAGIDSAKFCTVNVKSGEDLYILKNTSASDFVLTNAMVVTAGFPQTFWTGDDIKSVCYATSTGTNVFLINFE